MKEITRIDKGEDEKVLLSEMEMLHIYGGDDGIHVNGVLGCHNTTNKGCNVYTSSCKPSEGNGGGGSGNSGNSGGSSDNPSSDVGKCNCSSSGCCPDGKCNCG